jgi:polyphosphate kinase
VRCLGCTASVRRDNGFYFLADLVFHAARMYSGYDIVSSAAFRVTRNSNLYLAEEESRNLLESVRTELHNRRKGMRCVQKLKQMPIRRLPSACGRILDWNRGR